MLGLISSVAQAQSAPGSDYPPPIPRRLYESRSGNLQRRDGYLQGELVARGEGYYRLLDGQQGRGNLLLDHSRFWIEPLDGAAELRLNAAKLQRAVIGRDTFELIGGRPDLVSQQRIALQLGRIIYSRAGYRIYQVYQGYSLISLTGPERSRLVLCLPNGQLGAVPLQAEPLRAWLHPLFGQCPAVRTRMAAAGFSLQELTAVVHEYLEWQQSQN